MTKISVFEYSSYKSYLKALESQKSSFQKGFRSRLAETLSCQNAYVSQILNTHANFSLEQGLKIASFLRQSESETRYFVLLIEHARAGTVELKAYFKRDLDSLREKHLNIKERVPKAKELSFEDQSIYYSSWIYPTVHMMITIPHLASVAKIAVALEVSEEIINETLSFLVSTGLVDEVRGEFKSGATQIHLSKDSPFISQHHRNWRAAVTQYLTAKKDKGIHYSTVSSLSHDDAEKLKSKLVKVIQEYVEVIQPSKEETLYNFNLDFYSLIKD